MAMLAIGFMHYADKTNSLANWSVLGPLEENPGRSLPTSEIGDDTHTKSSFHLVRPSVGIKVRKFTDDVGEHHVDNVA
jgi:hypothetical protein